MSQRHPLIPERAANLEPPFITTDIVIISSIFYHYISSCGYFYGSIELNWWRQVDDCWRLL